MKRKRVAMKESKVVVAEMNSKKKPILLLHGRYLRKSSYSKGDDKIERVTMAMMILIVVPIKQQVLFLL